MQDAPAIDAEHLSRCLKTYYGIDAVSIEFLPLGPGVHASALLILPHLGEPKAGEEAFLESLRTPRTRSYGPHLLSV
jgi:hypothetical protein